MSTAGVPVAGGHAIVRIEYCSSCGYRAMAQDLSDLIKHELGNSVHDIVIQGGRPTSFEVFLDNGSGEKMLYSKLEKNAMPKFDALCAQIRQELSTVAVADGGNEIKIVPTAAGAGATPAPAKAVEMELADLKDPVDRRDIKRGRTGNISTPERRALLPRQNNHWAPLWLRWPLFWFPHNVNIYTARFTALIVVVGAIIVATNADQRWAWVMASCICADFSLRFLYGGRATVISTVAAIFSQFFKTRLTPGPPKQFAVMCGIMFSGAAVIAFWSKQDDDGSEIAGIVFMSILAFAASLESFFDICLGCLFFHLMVRIGLIKDPSIRCDSIADEMQHTIAWHDERTPNLQAPEVIVASVGKVDASNSDGVPILYKAKSEEWRREDFHPIRFLHITDFVSCMGLAGLALVFKLAESSLETDRRTWIALGIFAAVWSGIFILLYLAKVVLYCRKVQSEWACPFQRNFFCAIPLTILLFSILFQGENESAATVLFWIGAPLQFVLATITVARWIRGNIHRSYLSPSWMLPVVGNLVAAFAAAGARESGEYNEAAYLWFSSGVIFFVVLLTLTIARFATGGFIAPEMRASVWFYVAAPFLICSAYLVVVQPTTFDFFALNAYYFGLGMLCVMFWLILYSYFFRDAFTMAYWGYLFPLCTVALASMQFKAFVQSDFAHFMAVVSVSICAFVAATLVANTVLAFQLRRGIFRPIDKWSPISFMKLTHYAFREAIAKLQSSVNKLSTAKDDAARAKLLQDIAHQYVTLRIVHDEHSRHEENVIFPELQLVHPSAAVQAHHEHEAQHRTFGEMDKLLQHLVPGVTEATILREYLPGTANEQKVEDLEAPRVTPEAADQVTQLLNRILVDFIHHLDDEELHVTPLARQYFSLDDAVSILQGVWKVTAPARWRVIFPFVVRNQFVHGRRSRFLQCFIWAVPERAQVIGQMVFQGVDELTWDRLVADVPEIIPRNVKGHERYL